MYPTISDFLYALTGKAIYLPIQTFGFFMALAFLVALILGRNEFLRLEKAGILQASTEKQVVGRPASVFDILLNGVLGFVVGYKGLEMLMNWKYFSQNPQEFILSSDGNLIGGLIFGGLMAYFHYQEKKKEALPTPKTIEVSVFPHERVGDMTILAAVVGVLGSKVFTWIEDIPAFLQDPIGALTSFSGMTYYGGLICAALAMAWYARQKKIPLRRLADVAAPPLILGYGIGRLGCHFSGDGDWGIVNTHTRPDWLSFLPDWAWAYTYPNNVIDAGSVVIPAAECELVNISGHCRALAEGVWPTSVYEFLMAFSIFVLLFSLRKRLKVPGLLFSIYFILNGLERFCIEFVRVNDRYSVLGFELSQAQIIALLLMSAGFVFAYLSFSFYKKEQDSKMAV